MLILENKTDNGPGKVVPHFGGIVQVQVTGNFDGATATMQVSQDELPFLSLDEANAIFTQPDVVVFTILRGSRFQLLVENAGVSTDLTASALS